MIDLVEMIRFFIPPKAGFRMTDITHSPIAVVPAHKDERGRIGS
jgi:hypothetical protein